MQADPIAFSLDGRLAADTRPLRDLPLCRLLLMRDARWPGPSWCRAGRASSNSSTSRPRIAPRCSTRSTPWHGRWRPRRERKKNIGALGNSVRQFHFHVVARSTGDPNWPKPVWGFESAVPYQPAPTKRWSAPFWKASHDASPHPPRLLRQPPAPRRRAAHRRVPRRGARRPDGAGLSFGGGQWLCRGGETPDPTFSVAEASPLLGTASIELLLGHDAAGTPTLAAAVDQTDPPEGIAAWDLRTLGMRELLSPDVEGQLAQATHLLNWHAASRFCGRCGSATLSEAAGFRRRCTACGHLVFPRTDPVSIMLVHDGAGRCVLGRQPHFPPGMWSCLAGFVEAGETLEDAVRRETLEEAGLAVDEVRYHSSQPWPFPGSLMIGCIARAAPADIVFDATELEACRWFDREEVQAMLDGRHAEGLVAPARFAIAHHLLAAFASGRE